MDHYHFPRNKGVLEGDLCRHSSQSNPACGDQIILYICIENERVVSAKFSGVGCILSLAAADMLLESIKGKSLAQIREITAEDIKNMIGIHVGPTRIKCILLPLQALQHLYA